MADIRIHDEGTIMLLEPLTSYGAAWIDEHIPPEAPMFSGAVAVEPRYVPDIVKGMQDAGVVVA